jgi:predicted Zn-dependent protease
MPVSVFHIAVVPIGRINAEELEAVLARVAKVWRHPMEIRVALPVPHDTEDPERGQHRAAMLLTKLRTEVQKLGPGKLVGSSDPEAKPPYQPSGFMFVTDVDLYTARTEGALGALITSKQCAVTSIRRLREAFYRRKADPVRQRSRMVKEVLRLSARLAGLAECSDASCVLAPSKSVPDIDTKEERFCKACEMSLFEGRRSI